MDTITNSSNSYWLKNRTISFSNRVASFSRSFCGRWREFPLFNADNYHSTQQVKFVCCFFSCESRKAWCFWEAAAIVHLLCWHYHISCKGLCAHDENGLYRFGVLYMLTVMKIHYEHAVIDSIFDDHYCGNCYANYLMYVLGSQSIHWIIVTDGEWSILPQHRTSVLRPSSPRLPNHHSSGWVHCITLLQRLIDATPTLGFHKTPTHRPYPYV
jgi:hypothetical protein